MLSFQTIELLQFKDSSGQTCYDMQEVAPRKENLKEALDAARELNKRVIVGSYVITQEGYSEWVGPDYLPSGTRIPTSWDWIAIYAKLKEEIRDPETC